MTDSVRESYDTVARAYDAEYRNELTRKPLDRALLTCFVELAAGGTIADLGCGPGHVTQLLARSHSDVIGIDLSPSMIAVARERAPGIPFAAASMLHLPVAESVWSGVVAFYSIIHFTADQRATAFREFARTIRKGGWLLVAFHVDSAEFATGSANHMTSWFGMTVHLDGYFLGPEEITAEVEGAGFVIMSTTVRQPSNSSEYPSRRCYLMAQRT
jgi:ubiquinone/menaquinone biosynthesis C-methylase UbiE